MKEFTHLHVHTEYSLLDGACRINELVAAAKNLGQTSLAITDHGVMYGVIDFYNAAQREGIKPIIGCEVYVAANSRFNKSREQGSEYNHLVLLCKNETGYKNLIKLVSLGFTEGFYSKPRIDLELLKEHTDGLIALSACLAGAVPRAITADDYDAAKEYAVNMNAMFGNGNYYLELQDHGIPDQQKVNAGLIRISRETGIPLVATNDVHYVEKSDARLQNILLCIQTGKTVLENNAISFPTNEFYLKSGDEMAELFPSEAIENSNKIADMCNLKFKFGELKLPVFDIGEKNHYEFLRDMCYSGAEKRYGTPLPQNVSDRIEYELSVINNMGFIDYYLIVWDYVDFAKRKKIPVGPGRGSGAGSIVAYCIGITEVDPIKYGLIFERFLNPERVSMPDFDVDFCYVRRQEVIDYVVEKYGTDHVSQIVTFGTMAARAAVRDSGRAMAVPYATCDKVAKLIPRQINITIKQALERSKELRELYENDTMVHELVNTAMRLEGMPRHASKHAAGVVITDKRVDEYVPLATSEGAVVSQYTMTNLEALGLLKMDFLGLRNLTVIDDAQKEIRHNVPDFDIEKIPLDDEKTMKMFSAGATEGVFQFESSGLKAELRKMKPRRFEDLIALTSLYRPGPMDSIPDYIKRMHDPSLIKYDTPLLEDILKETYGCIVYQEQVMQVFRKLAGYSLGRADLVRRAMSKKKRDIMKRERHAFIFGDDGENGCPGAVKNGVPEKTAEKIFNDMETFSSYAFNKSHATAYALVAYRTAYLKCRYPREYLAALLTSVIDNKDKVIQYMSECGRLGIKLLPPNVNKSKPSFSAESGGIRFGLLGIKNLGDSLVTKITEERNERPFDSLYDFANRLWGRELNKRALESLIKAGALDGLADNRRQMLQSIDPLFSALELQKKSAATGQTDLFGTMSGGSDKPFKMPQAEEMPEKERLAFEKEITGLYLSGHPMRDYENYAASVRTMPLSALKGESAEEIDGKKITAVAMVTDVKKKQTKSGAVLGFVTVEDNSASVECLLFRKTVDRYLTSIKPGTVYVIKGRISVDESDTAEIIAEQFDEVNESLKHSAGRRSAQTLYLRVPSINDPIVNTVKLMLKTKNGDVRTVLVCKDNGKSFAAPDNMKTDLSNGRLQQFENLLGKENVRLI